ncbi:hypothetical protein CUJ84_pRLN3000563 (plasmid) [Rhizobium leguminosarum]|uniref:Uncharacterized protein n=1 Tax=Rhizobium leguminosarum TaxID=384 RepID=A0A2K9ZHL7_RHILE|nr:hypothetical protein CUJ84_pRLN3000563 [Rhizobium leguminosarum]
MSRGLFKSPRSQRSLHDLSNLKPIGPPLQRGSDRGRTATRDVGSPTNPPNSDNETCAIPETCLRNLTGTSGAQSSPGRKGPSPILGDRVIRHTAAAGTFGEKPDASAAFKDPGVPPHSTFKGTSS